MKYETEAKVIEVGESSGGGFGVTLHFEGSGEFYLKVADVEACRAFGSLLYRTIRVTLSDVPAGTPDGEE